MKKIIKCTLAILLGLCGTSACSGFLDENNPSGFQTIYDTPSSLEAATKGVFGSIWATYGIGGLIYEFLTPGSGLTTWGKTSRCNNTQWTSLLKFTSYSTSRYNGDFMRSIFKGITSANTLLDALEESPVDPALKLEAEAETRFYRAVIYYFLVRIYGDLPVQTKSPTAQTASCLPRDPYYKVYTQIIRDLEFAEQHMRSPQRALDMSPTYPRPNKYAATAYLASVYNTIGSLLASPDDNFWNPAKEGRSPDFSELGLPLDPAQASAQAYTKALAYAEKLIPESDTHDPECKYRLRSRFGDIFDWDGVNEAEDGENAYINSEQILVLPNTVNAGECRWTQYMLPEYAPGTSYTETNPQCCRHVCTRWVFDTWCRTYPGTLHSSGDYYMNSSDPRLDKTFIYGVMKNTLGETVNYYPASIAYDSRNAFPFFKKFASKRASADKGDADYIFMRFAEVYFIAAEAAAALGQDAKAYKYIDVIHARARHSVDAGKPDSTEPADWTGNVSYTGQELLDKIFWEWVFEFIGENFEYHNTHRHGANWMIRNICTPKNAFFDTPMGQVLFKTTDANSYYPISWKDAGSERYSLDPEEVRKGLLFTYPSNEILYNSALSQDSQNDYWFGF